MSQIPRFASMGSRVAILLATLVACGESRLASEAGQPGEALLEGQTRDELCFSVQDLGPTFFVPYEASLGINARGTVVGTRGTYGNRTAFVFDKGTFSEVSDSLGGGETELRAVNARGLAVGGSSNPTVGRAASYYKGTLTDLGEGPAECWSWAVNDRGVAVGDVTVSGAHHAAAFYGGEVFDLGILGRNAYANGINDHGDVVGSWQLDDGTFRGFIVPRGSTIQDFEAATGVSGVGDLAKISNGGTVCGSASMPDGYHGFLYRDGVVTDLGDLGFGWSTCMDVSDSGMAVGAAAIDFSGNFSAYLWRSATEGMIDLNTRIPADSARGVYVFWGSGVNSTGQVTAYGVNFLDFRGVEGYLLTPTSCPVR